MQSGLKGGSLVPISFILTFHHMEMMFRLCRDFHKCHLPLHSFPSFLDQIHIHTLSLTYYITNT
jgi:hypothetical protein